MIPPTKLPLMKRRRRWRSLEEEESLEPLFFLRIRFSAGPPLCTY